VSPAIAATASVLPAAEALAAAGEDPTVGLYPVPRNDKYTVERAITDPQEATTYNNFYEFGSHKQISKTAQRLEIRPWNIKIDGMVDLNDIYSQKPTTIMVRAIGYKTQVVSWTLPSEKPLTVVMTLLSIPDE